MKKKYWIRGWLLTINLILGISTSSWGSPLALDQNIKAVLAEKVDPAKGYNFIVIGDSRDGVTVYERQLERAKRFNPLFILNTGDIVKGGQAEEFENYKKQIAPCEIPILHVPGNHDIRNGEEVYHQYVGESNWYFDLGGIRIIGLDNAGGQFDDKAVAFARKILTDSKTCLVAFHLPPAVGRWVPHAMKANGESWKQIRELLKEDKVPMVFLGHIHLYDEMQIDGTQFIISAGGGAKLYTKYNIGKPEFGFLVVRVRPAGITHEWVPLD